MKPLSPAELASLKALAQDQVTNIAWRGDIREAAYTTGQLIAMIEDARETFEHLLEHSRVRDMSSIANPAVFRARELLARWNGAE